MLTITIVLLCLKRIFFYDVFVFEWTTFLSAQYIILFEQTRHKQLLSIYFAILTYFRMCDELF